MLFILYAISLVLVLVSTALDLPEAREVFRIFTRPDSEYAEDAIYQERSQ
jgi:hypothetical protein